MNCWWLVLLASYLAAVKAEGMSYNQFLALTHSDEGLTLETSVFESFTFRPCG